MDAYPDYCNRTHLCTKSFKTWRSDLKASKRTTWNSKNACDMILSKGINTITFFGDSYMRHMYLAVLLTLSNNYRNAGLSKPNKKCEYANQFDEKECRLILKLSSNVCSSQLKLIYNGFYPESNICVPSQLSFWSVGNHPVDLNYTSLEGINNSTLYSDKIQRTELCKALVRKHTTTNSNVKSADIHTQCSLFWVSTHARFKGHRLEAKELIKAYNEGMRAFFADPAHCGIVKYIDVFNMTSSLLRDMYEDAKLPTHDGAHWSIEVNLIKAQILLTNVQLQL